jgi:hypothetical protein
MLSTARPNSTNRSRIGGCLALIAALAALVVTGTGTGSATAGTAASAPPSVTDVDEAGAYVIDTVSNLAPGASFTNYWDNTPQNVTHFVDAWPLPVGLSQPCEIEVVRWWKEKWALFGSSKLRLHWTIKNVGNTPCGADVYLTWVNPAGN